MEGVYFLAEFLHTNVQPRMNFLYLILTILKTGALNGTADTALTKAV